MMKENEILNEGIFDKEIYRALGVEGSEEIHKPRLEEVRIEKPVKKKKRFKLTDLVQITSILFSGAALIISGLSWQESQKSRLITESTNRAILSVIDVRIEPSLYSKYKPVSLSEQEESTPQENRPVYPTGPTTYIIVVKNLGHIPATEVRFHYHIVERDSCFSEEQGRKFREKLENGLPIIRELLPGIQEEISISIPWEADDFESIDEGGNINRFSTDSYLLVGRLIYRDEATEQIYEQGWCYQLGDGTPEDPIKPCPNYYRY